jgi:hypothetical protein
MNVDTYLAVAAIAIKTKWGRDSVCFWLRRAIGAANAARDPRRAKIMTALNYARRMPA